MTVAMIHRLGRLLKGRKQYVIPDYQRPYVWGVDQLESFWAIIDNILSNAAGGGDRDYFLGMLALAKGAQYGPDLDQWVVLDGEQRLISLLLLVCAARDHGLAVGISRFSRVTDNYLVNASDDGDYHCKLVLTREDRSAFQACIQGNPDPEIVSPLTDAYRFFRAKLQESGMSSDPDYIADMLYAILENIELASVEADEETLFSLYSVEPARVRGFIQKDEYAQDVIAFAGRRRAIRDFRRLLEDNEFFDRESDDKYDGKAEAVWQNFFEDNSWIFGVSLAGQLLTSWSEERLEQVVAGSSIASVGKRTDALLRTVGRIRSMVFVECKTHRTSLLGTEYRSGSWSPSRDLVGGVAQLQGTIYRAVDQIGERLSDKGIDGAELPGQSTYLIRPRSFLVIGQLTDLLGSEGGVHPDRLRSFELYRRSIVEPEILTFDELLARAEWSVPSVDEETAAVGPATGEHS